MPLKAKLNGIDIYAFNFNDDTWLALKKELVQMHCCDTKAVLKKSKLGTRFFSHKKKGNCVLVKQFRTHF